MLRRRSNEDVKLVIDDNDTSAVTYSSEWGNANQYAAYFRAYDSTMHYPLQPNANASANASISFYGSYITAFGIIPSFSDVHNAGLDAEGSQIQSYQLDDGPTEFFNVTLDASKHFTDQVFFQPSTIQSDGHHTLVITNLNGMLALDYFTIVPADSDSSPYFQKIDDASPNITYNNAKPDSNANQSDFNNTLHSLSARSTAYLNFNGTFVAVYGVLLAGNSLPDVSFTLDNVDQSYLSGSIPRLSASRKQRMSQVLFWKSSTLANGQHSLLITATQGEFLFDFILIQTSVSPDGAGPRPELSSQSLKPATSQVPPLSTNAPSYGSPTPSSSASPSSAGASSDHTKNTSVIVGGVVGGTVGFIVLLLAFCMIRILYKRKLGLRSKTPSSTELSSQSLVQASLPVPTIAAAGTPYLVDSSGQVVGFILASSSIGSGPPPYQPRDEPQERQTEMNEEGKDVIQYGQDDKFAAFGQVQTDWLV